MAKPTMTITWDHEQDVAFTTCLRCAHEDRWDGEDVRDHAGERSFLCFAHEEHWEQCAAIDPETGLSMPDTPSLPFRMGTGDPNW